MENEDSGQELGFFTSFHQRAFALVWGSSMLSGSGQWTLLYARGWLVERLTGSAGWVGFTVFAGMIPYLFATPIGGLLADRFERRRVSAAMQGASLVITLVLAALTLSGVIQAWQVVALALLAGIARAMETPSTSALTPSLVPARNLLNAISLSSVATFGSQFIGPAVATLILVAGGAIGEVFLLTAVFYGIAMWLMLSSGARPLPERIRGNVFRETADSWKYVAATAMLPMVILLGSLHCGLTMTKDAVLPSFTTAVLHSGASTLSLLGMGFGAGTMVGTFALGGLRTEEAKGPLFLLTGLISGLAVAGLSFTHAPLPAFLLLSLMGAAQGMFMALGSTLILQVVPDELRGRVNSAYLMSTGGLMSFGNLGAGAFADSYGLTAVLLVPSLLFVSVLVALSALRPGLRVLYRSGRLPGAAAAMAAHAVVA